MNTYTKSLALSMAVALTPAALQAEPYAVPHMVYSTTASLPQQHPQGDLQINVGHMFDDNRNYISFKLDGNLAEFSNVSHKLGGEILFYDKTIDAPLGVSLETTTFALNYTMEVDPNSAASFYAGLGVGFQLHNLDSPYGVLDDDTTGYAQLFAGARFKTSANSSFNLGVRRMFLNDINIFGVSDLKPKHQWAVEAGFTIRF